MGKGLDRTLYDGRHSQNNAGRERGGRGERERELGFMAV